MSHYMNPAYGSMMGQANEQSEGPEANKEEGKREGQNKLPSIHIHSHAKGHTVHVMHNDGRHEKHEHSHGDADGISQHIHNHLGGGHAADAEKHEEPESAEGER